MLGAYGNAWVRTPRLDRLASQSLVFDQAIINSPDLAEIYDAYWRLPEASSEADAAQPKRSIITELRDHGVTTLLVTDEPLVASHPLAAAFSKTHLVKGRKVVALAKDAEHTGLARLFAAAGEALASATEPFLLWIHARGMGSPWDAPFELREQYRSEEDPLPSDVVEVPSKPMTDEDDPDELLDVQHRYAGQVSALDLSLGTFLDELDESARGDTNLFMFLSARGFPLGEHGRIGPRAEALDEALYSELIQVPWMLRLPDARVALVRSFELVQPIDVPSTLLDWCISSSAAGSAAPRSLLRIAEGEPRVSRPRAYVRAGVGEHGLRTPAWYARQDAAGRLELYAKPDDRWEVNQVADRSAEVAAKFEAELAQLRHNPQLLEVLPAEELLMVRSD